ncbi:MAG: PEGA domain-containing protein, partial [Myxococcales bacterium]
MIVHERGTGRFSLFTRSLAAALVALLAVPLQALAATSSSGGGGPQKVVVIGFGNEEGVAKHAARLEWEAAQMAATMGRYELLDLAALLDPEGEKAREEAGVQAKKNWAAAKGAYDELEVQLAVDLCDRAMGLYEKSDITRTLPEMVRAWTLKIASLIANADVPTANIEQNLLLPLDVDPNFDPNLFDPDFINNAKKKKADLQAKATLSIDVASKPVPARVFVDGKFRGVTPTEVKNLAPGDHFITLRAPGYKLIQKRTRAGAASSVGEALEATPHLAKFESVLSRVKQSFGTDSRAAPSRELAQLLGADQLVFVSVSRESQQVVHVAVARVRGSDGAEIAFQEENLADDEARYGSLSQ